MPIFLERFILPILVVAVGVVTFTNPMNWGLNERLIVGGVAVLLALVVALTIHRSSGVKATQKKASSPSPPVTNHTAAPPAPTFPPVTPLAGTKVDANIFGGYDGAALYEGIIPPPPFIPLEFDKLGRIFSSNTSVNITKMLAVYLNKRTHVSGIVLDVHGSIEDGIRLSIDTLDGAGNKRFFCHISLRVRNDHAHLAEIINKGEHIEVEGEIAEIDEAVLRLVNCHFIDERCPN